jgi:hypothetical protein
MFTKEDVVSTYTRAQAIEDGFLIDITASGNGLFKVPVAITCTAYTDLTHKDRKDSTTAIFKMLLVLFNEIKSGKGGGTQVNFRVDGIDLKSLSHPGDNGEHVITIMLPNED